MYLLLWVASYHDRHWTVDRFLYCVFCGVVLFCVRSYNKKQSGVKSVVIDKFCLRRLKPWSLSKAEGQTHTCISLWLNVANNHAMQLTIEHLGCYYVLPHTEHSPNISCEQNKSDAVLMVNQPIKWPLAMNLMLTPNNYCESSYNATGNFPPQGRTPSSSRPSFPTDTPLAIWLRALLLSAGGNQSVT